MKKLFGIIVISICIIIICLFTVTWVSSENEKPSTTDTWYYLDDNEVIGTFDQEIIIHYQDGTTSNDALWLYHDNKIIESFNYTLFGTPNEHITIIMQFYHLGYTLKDTQGMIVKQDTMYLTGLYNLALSSKGILCNQNFNPFDFVNYSYPDGDYTLTLIPSGEISVNSRRTNRPSAMSFDITVKDERAIDINFG